jgi:CBS domain-containing protein
MSVRELIKSKGRKVVSIAPESHVDAAARLLIRHEIGGLPVVSREDGALVGFLAEREIVRAVDQNQGSIQHLPIGQVMRSPAPVCSIDDPLREVMTRMTRDRLRHIVVLEGGQIAGIVSVGDMVKHRLQQLELETGVLRDYVAGQRSLG